MRYIKSDSIGIPYTLPILAFEIVTGTLMLVLVFFVVLFDGRVLLLFLVASYFLFVARCTLFGLNPLEFLFDRLINITHKLIGLFG